MENKYTNLCTDYKNLDEENNKNKAELDII